MPPPSHPPLPYAKKIVPSSMIVLSESTMNSDDIESCRRAQRTNHYEPGGSTNRSNSQSRVVIIEGGLREKTQEKARLPSSSEQKVFRTASPNHGLYPRGQPLLQSPNVQSKISGGFSDEFFLKRTEAKKVQPPNSSELAKLSLECKDTPAVEDATYWKMRWLEEVKKREEAEDIVRKMRSDQKGDWENEVARVRQQVEEVEAKMKKMNHMEARLGLYVGKFQALAQTLRSVDPFFIPNTQTEVTMLDSVIKRCSEFSGSAVSQLDNLLNEIKCLKDDLIAHKQINGVFEYKFMLAKLAAFFRASETYQCKTES